VLKLLSVATVTANGGLFNRAISQRLVLLMHQRIIFSTLVYGSFKGSDMKKVKKVRNISRPQLWYQVGYLKGSDGLQDGRRGRILYPNGNVEYLPLNTQYQSIGDALTWHTPCWACSDVYPWQGMKFKNIAQLRKKMHAYDRKSKFKPAEFLGYL
jgi:hypothetical protein